MAIPNSPCGLTSTIVIITLILQEISAQGDDSTTESIRQEHTIRVDPFDHFKKYKGGFNITSEQYWSSVVFTGIYGYAIGVLWLLCGIVCGVSLVTRNFCCQRDGGRTTNQSLPSNDRRCNLSPVPLAIVFLLLAMAASGVVIVGSAKFHSQARTSIDIIIKTANKASEIIHNATGALQDIQEDLVESNINVAAMGNLNSTADKFNDAAQNIVQKAKTNRHIINKDFKIVFVITVVIVSFNLVVATTLSVFGVLKFWRALYLLVLLCWLITVICWLLFGVYFFLQNFSNDACRAIFTFQENPYNNSLSYIIPCDELLSEKSVLTEIGSGIYNLVNEVNSNLKDLQETLFPQHASICNPFSPPPQFLYQPENCPPNTIHIGDIPKVLKPYTCFDDNEENCGNQDFLSSSEYEEIETYTTSLQNLLDVYPSMEDLLGCQLVKDAFSEVLFKHCKSLKKFSKMAWLGMVCLASIMVFFIVLWTIKALHEHSHHLSDGSVQTNGVTTNA